MSRSLLSALLLIAAPAWADPDPTVFAREDGAVVGSMVLPVAPTVVRSLVADGAARAADSPDVIAASARPDGACERLDLRVRGLFRPFAVQTRRCPTADGHRETLVASSSFEAWESTWSVQPHPQGGSRVTLVVHTVPNLPVPQGLVTQRTRRSVDLGLRALAEALPPEEGTDAVAEITDTAQPE